MAGKLIAALVVLLMPAGAHAAVCHYTKPLSAKEQTLREHIDERRQYGLPSGRDHVRRVDADPHARRVSLEFELPVTRREQAYMQDRIRLQDPDETTRLYAYLERHRDTLAEAEIRDDYPRGAYVLVRAKHDLARHRAAIALRFRLPFRVRRARYSERDLALLQNSIRKGALRAEGIELTDVAREPQRVDVDVVTPRRDAAAVIRRLYGPAVHVTVLGATPTVLACDEAASYSVDADGRTLQVTATDQSDVAPHGVEVIESAGEVRVGVVMEVPRGLLQGDTKDFTLTVTLAAPLGDRAVKSITDGKAVRRT